jgi:hypothetical protein
MTTKCGYCQEECNSEYITVDDENLIEHTICLDCYLQENNLEEEDLGYNVEKHEITERRDETKMEEEEFMISKEEQQQIMDEFYEETQIVQSLDAEEDLYNEQELTAEQEDYMLESALEDWRESPRYKERHSTAVQTKLI